MPQRLMEPNHRLIYAFTFYFKTETDSYKQGVGLDYGEEWKLMDTTEVISMKAN